MWYGDNNGSTNSLLKGVRTPALNVNYCTQSPNKDVVFWLFGGPLSIPDSGVSSLRCSTVEYYKGYYGMSAVYVLPEASCVDSHFVYLSHFPTRLQTTSVAKDSPPRHGKTKRKKEY